MLLRQICSPPTLAAIGLSAAVAMACGVSAQDRGSAGGTSPQADLSEACRSYSQAESGGLPIDPQEIIARYDRALTACDGLIDDGGLAGPELAAALVERADLLAPGAGDRYRRALADYARAITLTPNDATVFFKRGKAHLLYFRNLRQALADLDTAIRLDPSQADFFVSRASIRASLDDPDNALADVGHAIALAPASEKARSVRGLLHLNRRNYVRAIADFDAAIRLAPGAEDNYRFRAAARRAVGDDDGAKSDEAQADTRSRRSSVP